MGFEAFLQPITSALQPPWSYFLAVVALLMVLGPRLIDLRQDLLDVKAGRRRFEIEKARLEVLKLQYEIEQLRKQHPLPDIEDTLPQPPTPLEPEPEESERPRIPKWFTRHTGLSKALLLITQGLLAYFMIICAVFIVAAPVMWWSEHGPGVAILGAITYAAFTWLCYVGFAKVRRLRKSLANRGSDDSNGDATVGRASRRS
jgi:hypothetical protein